MNYIGSKYFSNLIRLGGLVRNLLNGGFQEDTRTLILNMKGGRCYYNDCYNKKEKSDRRVLILNDSGRKEEYAFHGRCIDSMIKDERIPSMN